MNAASLVFVIASAIFVGGALKDFFQAVITGLVTPFLSVMFADVQQTVEGLVVQVGPVTLKVGDAIGAAATLAVALVVVSVTLPLIKKYSPKVGGRR